MPLGYDIKEEATEVKKNLFERRDNFIMLVVAGVVGGIVTRFIVPKLFLSICFITNPSIYGVIKIIWPIQNKLFILISKKYKPPCHQ